MMDWQRTLLLLAIATVSILLFREWGEFQHNRPVPVAETTLPSQAPVDIAQTDTANAEAGELPSVPSAQGDQPSAPSDAANSAPSHLIAVETDVLSLLIDPYGGDIVKAALKDHYNSLEEKAPFILLDRTASHTYVAQSGLIGRNGTDAKGKRPLFRTQHTRYRLAEGDDQLTVDFTTQQQDVTITKRLRLKRGDHLINIKTIIDNGSDQPWAGNFYGQIKRDGSPASTSGGAFINPFLGAAITTQDDHYKKFDFGDLDDESFATAEQGGWVAMVQHYFISAWIPPQDSVNHYKLRRAKDYYYLSFTTNTFEVPAGQKHSVSSGFYVGPKDIHRLETISPYLDLTIDYGWLWMIAKPLFLLLNFIHSMIGNWGFAIILLTLSIKGLFFYPTAISFKSMAKMRNLQPKMQELKERYGDDRQKMSTELMKLYRTEGVNPVSGCLPHLIQMPVFIALYWVLMESVELRHAPFLGWIQDLSVMDPWFILPLLMGTSSFIMQKFNPTPADPTQAMVMKWLPVMMTVMFLWFPAGLVLYWTVNNLVSIGQQWLITRQINAAKAKR